jgi:hypothetical protein
MRQEGKQEASVAHVLLRTGVQLWLPALPRSCSANNYDIGGL